jgi:4-hydroxy-tetrahydrodipicolinate synthase
MIEYGSDYLLGLSTFTPELFAARDRAWAEGKAEYLELRDFIQYLGWVGFRDPVPAYKHSAAIFLKLTGGLESDEPHPKAPRREEWDRALLADAARRFENVLPHRVAPR